MEWVHVIEDAVRETGRQFAGQRLTVDALNGIELALAQRLRSHPSILSVEWATLYEGVKELTVRFRYPQLNSKEELVDGATILMESERGHFNLFLLRTFQNPPVGVQSETLEFIREELRP